MLELGRTATDGGGDLGGFAGGRWRRWLMEMRKTLQNGTEEDG